ncbi:MAG: RnfABCDGE type electron transport complex subunit B [Candidatus Omnitrophica bacterium]|nr:RnfABCDGE type electron transport complex subunit B [Candidatus Omnitrophota bacterium]
MDNLVIASILSMAGLSIFFASVLAFADKKLKVEEDPEVDRINHLLPGVNCGACGFLSCHDFAEHIVNEGADPAKCRVVDKETREEICKDMGISGGETYSVIPLIHCAAEEKNKKFTAEYRGIKTCSAANLVFGGGLECQYGCMGLGDCTRVCPFGALYMENGLPRVDQTKCTGCGKCEKACPRNIISMREKKTEELYYVACSSHDTALRVRQVCGVGCIACGICVKLSPKEFFKVEDNLSHADFSKQSDQKTAEMLAGKCPTKVIKKL